MPGSLKIQPQRAGDRLELGLSGAIDGYADLSAIFAPDFQHVAVDFAGVSMIDSAGVSLWVRFLLSFPPTCTFEYHRCPTDILAQFNMVGALTTVRKTIVRSAYLPFCCPNCDLNQVALIQAQDLRFTPAHLHLPAPKCPKCAAAMALDADPGELLACLERQVAA